MGELYMNVIKNILAVSPTFYYLFVWLYQPYTLKKFPKHLSSWYIRCNIQAHSLPSIFTISATVLELIMLKNVRLVNSSSSLITFDGQMWLESECILTGIFCYYNSFNDSFSNIGQYFAWIHIHKSLTTLWCMLTFDRSQNLM